MVDKDTVIDFTYADIKRWDRLTTRKNFADPAMRPLIDEIIRRHNEGDAAQVEAYNAAAQEATTARLNREQEEQAKAKELRDAAQAEITRFANLTPDQRAEELAQKQKKDEEEAKEVYLAQVAKEREAARLSLLTPEQRRQEIEDAQVLEAQVEAERVAEEARKAEAEANKVRAAETEAAKIAAEQAEVARKEAEEKAKAVEAPKPKQKIIVDYQAEDDHGNPIGRRTHLEAETNEEMIEKMKVAHINAMKFAERMKKRAEAQPTTVKAEKVIPVLTEAQRAEIQKDLESKDATKVDLARIKLEQDEINRDRKVQAELAERTRQAQESNSFITNNPSFYPCQANADVLSAYILKHKLEWNASNLEIALDAEEAKLAPRPQANPVVEEPKAPTAAQVAEAEAAKIQAEREAQIEAEVQARLAKIEQEKATANPVTPPASVVDTTPVVSPTSDETVPTAANPPVVPRKLPTGGLEPGALHGGRPQSVGSKAPVLTKQDIAKMSREEYRKRMKNPEFQRQVEALFRQK